MKYEETKRNVMTTDLNAVQKTWANAKNCYTTTLSLALTIKMATDSS
jgi:hypothetical protein